MFFRKITAVCFLATLLAAASAHAQLDSGAVAPTSGSTPGIASTFTGQKLVATSTTPLSIGSNAGLSSDFAGGAFVLDNDAFFTTAQLNVHSDDSSPAFLIFSKTRGTHATPVAVQNNDGIGSIFWTGFGTGYSYVTSIRANATEAWDGAHHGTKLTLTTNKNADAGSNDYVFGQDGSTTLPGLLVDTTQAALSLGGNAAATADEVNEGITIDNNVGSRIRLIRHSNDFSSPTFNIEKSRGTHASPTAILSGDSLGSVGFRAHDGSSFTTGPLISSGATETWDATHHGASLTLKSFKNAAGIGGLGGNSLILDQDGSTTLPGTLVVPSTITEERDGADPSVTLAAHATSPFNSIPRFQFKVSRGTAASPTAIQNGDLLGSISMSGYNGTLYQTNAPSIFFTAMENWSVGHNGAEIDFTSCAIGNSCPVTMTLQTDGKLSVPAGIVAPVSGATVAFTTKTSGTTITLTSTTHSAYVVACGAGGGGGGTTTAAASAAVGGGGAAGACVGKYYTSLTPSASLTIAIGTAGTAGSSSGGDGGLGGDSTFSDGTTVITGKGGNGGKGETAGSAVGGVDGGAGVIGTLGDWNGAGAPGTPSMRLSGLFAVAGTGGSCAYGGGGIGSGATGTGATALGRCSGGGGGNVENNSTAVAGGAGTGGVVLVWEYQ